MRETRTDVLVAGAGPVGLCTALLLAEAGLEVSIIDREVRTTTRSYACALHPHTLSLLKQLGLAEAVLAQGRRVSTVAFYDGPNRRAELDLSQLGGEFPFLVILPQGGFENLLEQRLAKAGVNVSWAHRFDDLVEEGDKVSVAVEELGGTATGYVVPHFETVVKRRFPVRVQFLIGADGHNSLVRQRLGIEFERLTASTSFAAYEFEPDQPCGDEVRVVMDQATTNVLWPLPGNKYRWTFQIDRAQLQAEFPEKERRSVRLTDKIVDDRIRQYVQKVAQQRAPWFSATIKDVPWCTEVAFEHRLVKKFGQSRCWLVGDAAHQAGPVGIQSMNLGFREAESLAALLPKIVRGDEPLESLVAYNQEQQTRWRRLLGLTGGLKARGETQAWVKDHAARLLACLPASDGDLEKLAGQLKLDLP